MKYQSPTPTATTIAAASAHWTGTLPAVRAAPDDRTPPIGPRLGLLRDLDDARVLYVSLSVRLRWRFEQGR